MQDDAEVVRSTYLDKLRKHIDDDVYHYLQMDGCEIINLLADWLILLENIKIVFRGEKEYYSGRYVGQAKASAQNLYSEYSFLIAPIYKAYEGFLYLLANSLGLKTSEQIILTIGRLYDEEAITRRKDEIITELGESLNKSDREVLGKLSELKRVLELYRHNPAHYLGTRLETMEKAENYGKTILTVINETTKYFMEKKYIGK
jgi:hypothetical protein